MNKAFLVIFALCAILLVGCGDASTTTGASIPTATSAPTVASKSQPTPTPSGPLAPVAGSTVLGQPLSHFVAKYGQPQVMGNGASYDFKNHTLSIDAFKQDNYLVSGVLYGNSDGNGWNSDETATTACRQFLPADADYKRTVNLGQLGYERVYVSPSLAPLFPASDFTDENNAVTTPGTIAIDYGYPVGSTGPQVINCAIQVGLQSL